MKTRAWDGERFRDDYVIMPDGSVWVTRTHTPNFKWGCCDPDVYAVKVNWKLLRFTGLLDKNGKEIWEHDICKIKGFHVTMQDMYPIGPVHIETPFDYVRIVKMDNHYSPVFDIGEGSPDIEVIGNIFQNTELLEV